MFEVGSVTTATADALDQHAAARAQLAAAEQQLLAADLSALSGEQLLGLLDVLEIDARRHAAVGCALIAELADRGVAEEAGYTSAVVLLSERLRIGRREAAGRVRLAADLGPRRALSGERLPARFPGVADAVAEGAVSARHAAVICTTIDRIPGRVADEQPELVAQVEPTLLDHARALDPDRLAVLARSVTSCLDPDGQLASERDHQRHREAILTLRPDGSGRLTASLTGEATAVWQTVLDTLSRPVPGEDGEADRRTPGQRRHDGLLDAGRRLLRSGELPDAGGTPATVLLTLTLDQLEERTGLATTGHGGTLSIAAALRLAAEAKIVPVVVGDAGGVLGYGVTRRVASTGQRLALAARDKGCVFPACDRPPHWCESHHVTPWAAGGSTDVDNLILLCGFHHREHAKRGWIVRMVDGRPEWTPPRWIDALQIPRRNQAHHVPIHFPAPTLERRQRDSEPGSDARPDARPLAYAS